MTGPDIAAAAIAGLVAGLTFFILNASWNRFDNRRNRGDTELQSQQQAQLALGENQARRDHESRENNAQREHVASESKAQREHAASENQAQREHEKQMLAQSHQFELAKDGVKSRLGFTAADESSRPTPPTEAS